MGRRRIEEEEEEEEEEAEEEEEEKECTFLALRRRCATVNAPSGLYYIMHCLTRSIRRLPAR